MFLQAMPNAELLILARLLSRNVFTCF